MAIFSYDEAMEKCLLGALMLGDRFTFEKVASVVSSHHFYQEYHQKVFEVIRVLADRHEAIDLITVQAELVGQDLFEQIGGLDFLVGLFEGTPTADQASDYAGTVRLCALWRGH